MQQNGRTDITVLWHGLEFLGRCLWKDSQAIEAGC